MPGFWPKVSLTNKQKIVNS